MNVPSFAVLGFAVLGAIIFNLTRALAWRRCVLLVLNLAFFATFAAGVVSVLPYVLFLAAGFIAMRMTERSRAVAVMWMAVGAVLLLFFWLKHYSFIPRGSFLPFPYVAIGLSYVFFRVLHLVIEAHDAGASLRPSLLSYVNYTLHFPALISGPIQLYPDYQRMESVARPPVDVVVLGNAVWRVTLGFFKVAIVSVLLMKAQQLCITSLTPDLPLLDRALLSGLVWAIYPLFLYANFSGYTDFVIGIASLYGFALPENFNNPFISENFIAFWSRWHITLSNWLKTYVYMPIMINAMRRYPDRRAEAYFAVLAYFVTFFLVGAWHGQTSMFLFFGVLQGGGVAANKLYQIWMVERLGRKGYKALTARPAYQALCRGLTFTWFAFTLLWFWSNWTQMSQLLAASGAAAALLGAVMVFVVAIVALAALAALTSAGESQPRWLQSRYTRTALATAMTLIVIASITLVAGPPPDIVYKNF